ncbi:MAG TPA: iron uptake porin, partial [Coleofasciculaceae cyanobacterium]
MRPIRQNFLPISLINAIALLVLLGRTVAAEDLAKRTIEHNPEHQTGTETTEDWSIDTKKDTENKQDKGEFTTTILSSNAPLVKEDLGESSSLETDSSDSELSDSTPSLLEQIQEYSDETIPDDTLEQVTDVSQLRDVRPGDWAYEALRALVEKYGAIAGYPDGTFRGNRAITRYEFAAGLLRVFDQIQLLLTRGEDPDIQADLTTLQQLTQGFVTEIALLRGQVDGITARTGELELTQFSITTKLQGEVILGFATIATGDDANSNGVDDVDILGHRTRLNLETSFTGRDLLRTRLQAEGLGSLESRTLTPEGELAFTGATDNDLQLDALLYSFPLGDRTTVAIAANADAADDFAQTVNSYFDGDGASGALSRFATRPPIYYLVTGAGVGVRHRLSDKVEVSLGYLAEDVGNPAPDAGLFDGAYGALAQVVVQPSERLTLGLTYVHAYNKYLQTGSNSANLLGLPTVSNSYGIEASYQINPRFVVGGWVGYTAARVIEQGDANIWNWALTLALPDFGKAGNIAGFLIGMEPKVTGSDDNLRSLGIDDPSTSLHLEAFYQYRLSDHISITPGIIWLTAPNHNSDNSDVVI